MSDKSTKPVQSASPSLGQQTLTIQQTLDLALQHHTAGRLPQAESIYQQILQTDPSQPVALHLLGVIAHQVGKNDIAVDLITKALAIRPDNAEAHSNLGLALKDLGKLDEAVAGYHKALAIKPDFAEAHYNLGNALKDLGKLDEAVASYHNALAIKPDYADAHNNLGAALQDLGKLDEAVASYHKALATKSEFADAHSNLGNALTKLGKLDEAVASCHKALAIKPDFADAHNNLSFALLIKGRLKEGLDEYEWRWRVRGAGLSLRRFTRPMWDGTADLSGRTILLWPEQGPYDVTVWASCVPEMVARAGHCILEVHPKLVPLFARSFAEAEVRTDSREQGAEPTDFDFHLPMGSLYRHLRPDLATAAEPEAYLVPDPDRIAFWKARLAALGPGPFVGISWKSPLITPARSPNYTRMGDWKPVFGKQAQFVNLQCRDYRDDLAEAKREFGATVHDFEDLDLYDDLDDVAALAGALDVAISVHTCVSAITAGVGTPTWRIAWRQNAWNNFLFIPQAPSMTSFERDTGETWDGVFAAISGRLQDLIDARIGGTGARP